MTEQAVPVVVKPKLSDTFIHPADELILRAIHQVYGDLSPENLSCDGEATLTHIRRTQAECNRRLNGLFAALGRRVDETEVYEWVEARDKFLSKVGA